MLDSLPHDCIEHKLSKEKLERKMSTLTPGTSLPFVPGMTFSDPTKQAFHRSQTLGFTNGYAMKNQVLFDDKLTYIEFYQRYQKMNIGTRLNL